MISLTPYKKETNFSKYETLLQAIKEQKSAVKYISSIYPTTKCFVYAEIYKVTLFKFKLFAKRKAKDEISL